VIINIKLLNCVSFLHFITVLKLQFSVFVSSVLQARRHYKTLVE